MGGHTRTACKLALGYMIVWKNCHAHESKERSPTIRLCVPRTWCVHDGAAIARSSAQRTEETFLSLFPFSPEAINVLQFIQEREREREREEEKG